MTTDNIEKTQPPWEKMVRARLNPELLLIVEEAKADGYTGARIVREGLILFGKERKLKKSME